uniref:TF-B3 domain-containing protein n=1 Tax=Oryza glumipatula TaxID=40148 RepID=A0A0D9YRV3_9ORYZ
MAASLPLSAAIVGAEESVDKEVLEMEYLFEKFLMPSDLCSNTEWLGIPEEHVRKFGMMLEDRDGYSVIFFQDGVVPGKLWCFRYWKSNGVHGLTKGWRCFVREKGLKAGDTISFFRGSACGRLFICCRLGTHATFASSSTLHHGFSMPPPPARPLVGLESGMLARDVPLLGQARLHDGNQDGGSAPSRHVPSSGQRVEAQLSRVSSRRQGRTMKHSIPEPTIETPPILESMFLIAAPPAVKCLRLFGVNIYVLPVSSSGQPKQESSP